MIVIAGSTHDDILYFESIMSNKKEETILNHYPIITGKLFSQDVLLVYNIYSSYASSIVTTYLINNYFVVLFFNVGKCIAFSDDLKTGEIIVCKHIRFADVDQMDEVGTRLGQVPGFNEKFEMQNDVLETLDKSLQIRTLINNKIGTCICSNTIYTDMSQLEPITHDNAILGETENVVIDSISGGTVLACSMHGIPFAVVKVVYKKVGEKNNANKYAKVLTNYTGVGKAIVTCIGDISRNDVVKEGEDL